MTTGLKAAAAAALRRMGGQGRTHFAILRQRYRLLGLIAALGYPGYYLVWTHLYPQPYESLALRLAGAALAVPLVAEPLLRGRHDGFMYWYAQAYALFALPFFFTFMNLMNGANMAWQMSLVASILYLALFLESFRFLAVYALGSLLGYLAFRLAAPGLPVPQAYLDGWPVFLFAVTAGFLFNYGSELARSHEKMKGAASVGGSIAHEMRTPLLGMRLDVEGLSERLPRLLEAAAGDPRHAREAAALSAALGRVRRQLDYASTGLDLMLGNMRDDLPPLKPETLSMAAVARDALDRYPFRGPEAARVRLAITRDFAFAGSGQLMVHVLHNLVKNALRATAAGGGEVVLTVGKDPGRNTVEVLDHGEGVPAELAPRLFEPFASGGHGGLGVGLGLSFCKRVVRGMGGSISLFSRPGGPTTVVICVPTL